jgi:probable rRNA maturation factor
MAPANPPSRLRRFGATRPATPTARSGEGGLTVHVVGVRLATRGLAAWLRRAAPARARGEVTIALVGDARVRALNRTYRGKDYATDVLSFPASGEGRKGRKDSRPSLGDIVIATGVARRQARALGHHFTAELRILALHGLLHLLGYDHERDRGRMRRLEQRLLRRTGLRDGLIERARPSILRQVQDRPEHRRRATSVGRGKSLRARGEPVEPRAAR